MTSLSSLDLSINLTGTYMPRVGCTAERITAYWADFPILISTATHPGDHVLFQSLFN